MHQQDKKGFTIIELMLAMSVVALLLLAIATMTMQMITIMTKGNTFRELNAAGRTINDDFTREFNSIYGLGEWTGKVVNDPTTDAYYVRNGDSGAFCDGKSSYLWNLYNNRRRDIANDIHFQNGDPIRLVRASDPTRSYCQDKNLWTRVPNNSNVKNILSEGETGLMLYDIQFSTAPKLIDNASNQSIVNIAYVLGTKNDNNQINVAGMNCNPTGQYKDYCAINKFDITVRTLGRK